MSSWQETPLATCGESPHDGAIEPLISHQDVTTIMELLADMKDDLHVIRELLEDDDGEEEAPEADA